MKTILTALVLSLSFVSASQAFLGETRVRCEKTGFADLTRIEIQETDLDGQYQIVETLYNSATNRTTNRFSPVFGMEEIEKSEFPALTPWYGYERKLIRNGRGLFSITAVDECSSFSTTLTCEDTL